MTGDDDSKRNPSPLRRLLLLLGKDRKDIGYIYLYALFTGLISLSLPLGIQAVFNLVSGGMVFSSVYVMIALTTLGALVAGLLLVGQAVLVEVVQQRIFTRTAFEFTYRLAHIQPEALEGHHAPELMNRFFDVLSIQKGLPKLLIELTGAGIQIVFGTILLSFYHPAFLAIGVFSLVSIIGICWIFGPGGLDTSLMESKYKYKIAAWLQNAASDLPTLRSGDNVRESIDRMDDLVSSYLIHRNAHFRLLRRFQYTSVGFRTLITGGLLVMGTALVVGRQMSLGQFVAAELVIVLISVAVEKLMYGLETVFDMMTAVEKLSAVTDLPLVSPADHV